MHARQAISTKYLGPTDCRGSRVKAACDAGSLTLSWDDSLDTLDNHAAAARALATRLGWSGQWVAGSPHDTTGYTFVNFVDGTSFTI